MSYKFFTKCPMCKKDRLFIAHRKIDSNPINGILKAQAITSVDMMCSRCIKTLRRYYKNVR